MPILRGTQFRLEKLLFSEQKRFCFNQGTYKGGEDEHQWENQDLHLIQVYLNNILTGKLYGNLFKKNSDLCRDASGDLPIPIFDDSDLAAYTNTNQRFFSAKYNFSNT